MNAPVKVPADLEAEGAILGAAIVRSEAIDLLEESLFYDPRHRSLARLILAMRDRGEAVDVVTLAHALRSEGADAQSVVSMLTVVHRVIDGVGGIAAANAEHWAEILRERARQRSIAEVYRTGAERAIAGDPSSEVIAAVESQVIDIRVRPKTGLRPVGEAVAAAFRRTEARAEQRGGVTGISTGLRALDDKTAGLQRGDLIVIGARPSQGKTSLAMGIATYAAIAQGQTVAVFSLEMSCESLALRMLASEARIEGARMRVGLLNDDDWPRLARAAPAISGSPMWIDDTGAATLQHIQGELRRLAAARGPVGLVVVDYLGLMSPPSDRLSPEQALTQNSAGLKAIAKNYDCPVIMLSQLNRSLEQRQDKRPVLSDARGSGAIEQDADLMIFIYRDEVYNPESEDLGVAELIIAKQRNGPIGTVKVRFRNEFTLFEDLDGDVDLPPRE